MVKQHIHRPLAGVLMISTAWLGAARCLAGGDVIWSAGSTQFVLSDLHLTSTLTIEEGVTVMTNSGVAIYIEAGGNLIVNGTAGEPVLFTSNGPDRWDGLVFEVGSEGDMTQAIIEHTNDVGLRIISSSPLIDSCVVRDVAGAGAGASARGIYVTGAGAGPTIHRCLIENVVGADGAQGTNTGAAGNGGDGANGTLLSNDGQPGGSGDPGAIGGTGTAGGWGYGIVVESGAQADISSNHIRNIQGGKGGKGGNGGAGGDGGDGGDGYNVAPFQGAGGNGGNGGAGGPGGVGGVGGWAIAIRLWDLPSSVTVAQNLVQQLTPGQGGQGGTAGLGGDGGYGGPGVEGPFCIGDTPGGDGGDGGNGGPAGTGGQGGTARAFDSQNGGASLLLVQNTAAALVVGPGGSPGVPGFGGFLGLGGGGGDCAGDGADGSNGSTGAGGQNGQPGTRHGAFAANLALQVNNNIITFSGAPSGTALVTSGSGTITAGTNCFFGFSSLSDGSVTVLAGNVLDDPLFVDAANLDFHLQPSSPAIDAGDNASMPVDLLTDLDGLERVVDGDADGNAIVDMGAFEYQVAVPCLADLSDDGNVGPADLAQLLASWGACKGCPADFNGDDQVGPADLAELLASWGTCE